MTTSQMKKGLEETPETSCISHTPQTMKNVQYSIPTINQTLSEPSRVNWSSCDNSESQSAKKRKGNFLKLSRYGNGIKNTELWETYNMF